MSKLNIGSSLLLDLELKSDGTEIKTGLTFNGKPVYYKCIITNVSFTGNTGSVTQTALLFNIPNFGSEVFVQNIYGSAMEMPLVSPYSVQAWVQRSAVTGGSNFTIYFRNSGSTYTTSVQTMILYTKTTD